ncbi:MAG: type IV pilus twitching motility protein PilT [Patescibacteria group bacterium]|jgi:twitching motility protein PilT|nr:type IV pilus twitching motility protein PilT [Patescibacteria group bacterium]MDD4466816.1 type IV pilus twitching motility protein PilT [Patescibacteria group bacterium]
MDLKKLLKLAATHKASDLHLMVGQPPILRIDGELKLLNSVVPELGAAPLEDSDLRIALKEITNSEQLAIFLEKKDLDFSYEIEAIRFRVNLSFEKNNLRLVARVIEEKKPTLEEIGMPPIIKELLTMPQGLILVTGPTGCGKSTTLAAMINYINNTRSCHIVTLEDPMEYVFTPNQSLVTQRQLGSDMTSFASGLKHVLRQDPNVIMIGEMRDYETVAAAITLAETGHLVLATLHTYSAIQTVDRIIDIFPPHQQNQVKSQLSMLLTAVISQRLLPKIGGGRVAARELLIRNSAIANLIREGKISQIKSVMQMEGKNGMITLDKHLKELYKEGLITKEVATLYADDPAMG